MIPVTYLLPVHALTVVSASFRARTRKRSVDVVVRGPPAPLQLCYSHSLSDRPDPWQLVPLQLANEYSLAKPLTLGLLSGTAY